MAHVADHLRVPRGDVARHHVPVGRVLLLEVVPALVLGDVVRVALVPRLARHPDPAVVPQRLRHQGQLRLVVAALGNRRRVDLDEARVGKAGATPVGPPDHRRVAPLGAGGQEVDVGVPAGADQHRVGHVRLELAGHHVAADDAAGLAVDDDDVLDVPAGEHLHLPGPDLARESRVGAEQELLAGLAPGVERALHQHAAEGPVGEHAAVLPGERHALGDALVDDVPADLGEAPDVGLPGAEVAALDRVVEQAVDRVAVVLVVLRRVDPALGGDRVGPARAVLEAERQHLVAQLGEGRRGGGPGEPRADHDHRVLPLVRGAEQLDLVTELGPLVLEGTGGNACVEFHRLPPVGSRLAATRGLSGPPAAGSAPAGRKRGSRCSPRRSRRRREWPGDAATRRSAGA